MTGGIHPHLRLNPQDWKVWGTLQSFKRTWPFSKGKESLGIDGDAFDCISTGLRGVDFLIEGFLLAGDSDGPLDFIGVTGLPMKTFPSGHGGKAPSPKSNHIHFFQKGTAPRDFGGSGIPCSVFCDWHESRTDVTESFRKGEHTSIRADWRDRKFCRV